MTSPPSSASGTFHTTAGLCGSNKQPPGKEDNNGFITTTVSDERGSYGRRGTGSTDPGRTGRALGGGRIERAETGGECGKLGWRHLPLDALEENALYGADVSPEALAKRGQPFVEPRHGVAVQVPNLCPHVVVLANEAADKLGSIADVLHGGGKQMGFLSLEVWSKARLEELDEPVHLPSAVRRPTSPRCGRPAQGQPLRQYESVVMLARQGNKTLVALHDDVVDVRPILERTLASVPLHDSVAHRTSPNGIGAPREFLLGLRSHTGCARLRASVP